MFAVLLASTATYLLRNRVERVERVVQGVDQHRYLQHIQTPAAAVIVAAVSGYGINIVTENDGFTGYLGFLLALPLPLAMVAWNGYRAVRQTDFERQWPPPASALGSDRVRIRTTLRRVQAESADLRTADQARIGTVLQRLRDEAVPALRQRRDRTLHRWLRDHPMVRVPLVMWTIVTLGCAAAAVLPRLPDAGWRAVAVLLAFVLATAAMATALPAVLRRHSRYRYGALAEEVDESVQRIRRRITVHVLGVAATVEDARHYTGVHEIVFDTGAAEPGADR